MKIFEKMKIPPQRCFFIKKHVYSPNVSSLYSMTENEFDVFISYSRKDSEVANRIYDALSAEGVSCFIDREGISGGADFPTVLSEAIMGAKVLLLVASEHSYASEFTQKELTFAVSNKGSRFIFPVIVDGSTLPKNLEFLLSNINWRTLSSRYRIEKELVADVKKKLADPQAGMTIKQREKNTVKIMMIIIFSIIGLGLAALGYMYWQNNSVEEKAQADRKACADWLKEAKAFVYTADTLRNNRSNYLETFEQEIAALNEAEAVLARVDSLREVYMNDSAHAFQFTQYTTAATKNAIRERRDSMFVEWNKYAIDNFNDYEMLEDDIFRDIALEYVEKALILHPYDANLQSMKTKLTE